MVYYTPSHVRSVLTGIGVEIEAETEKRFNCFCPFHDNTSTPAFSISKEEGVWLCFNESCAERGNLEQLVARTTGRTDFEALRYIAMRDFDDQPTLAELLDEAFAPEPEWPVFPEQVVMQLVENFWAEPKAQEYMHNRGFTDDVLKHFQLGYSPKSGGQVVYPVHNPDGKTCVGIVGRGIESKFFDNSKNMPRKRILFNMDRARSAGKSCVVVEAGFDAMRVHQAGHPCVVATLGSAVSERQLELLERNFTEILVFSDNDEAGLAMRRKIQQEINSAAVLHCSIGDGTLFPSEGLKPHPKDVGDLRIEQIQKMIKNSTTLANAGIE